MKKNPKASLSLNALKLESFITNVDSAKAKRIAGGYASEAGHTTAADKIHVCK
jgi:hypothetical protein